MKNYNNYIKLNEITTLEFLKMVVINDISGARLYLQNGGDVNVVDSNKQNGLMMCANIFNVLEMIELLLEYDIDIDAKDLYGETALIIASRNDFKNVMRLIDADADWELLDSDGNDFLSHLFPGERKRIINKYPEKYEKHLQQLKANEFNL